MNQITDDGCRSRAHFICYIYFIVGENENLWREKQINILMYLILFSRLMDLWLASSSADRLRIEWK